MKLNTHESLEFAHNHNFICMEIDGYLLPTS